jgi:hypothetical protein
MTLLLLEALGAGLIFIGIIWWTMFAGRKHGELPTVAEVEKPLPLQTEGAVPHVENKGDTQHR